MLPAPRNRVRSMNAAREAFERGELQTATLFACDLLMLYPNERAYLETFDLLKVANGYSRSKVSRTYSVWQSWTHCCVAYLERRGFWTNRVRLPLLIWRCSKATPTAKIGRRRPWCACWIRIPRRARHVAQRSQNCEP